MATIAKKSTSNATTKNGKAKAKKVSAKKAPKVKKVETPKQVSKRVLEMLEKSKQFDVKTANNWQKLGEVSRQVNIKPMGFNKMIKFYLSEAKLVMPKDVLKCITFANVKEWVSTSIKYQNLEYFTANDAKLICNAVIRYTIEVLHN